MTFQYCFHYNFKKTEQKTGTTCETDTMSTCIGTIKLKKGKSKCCSQIKKILQIDIKNVGGAVIYSKDISGFFYNQKKKPQKVGENLKKSSFVFFFVKKKKIRCFQLFNLYPHSLSALKGILGKVFKRSTANKSPRHRKFLHNLGIIF